MVGVIRCFKLMGCLGYSVAVGVGGLDEPETERQLASRHERLQVCADWIRMCVCVCVCVCVCLCVCMCLCVCLCVVITNEQYDEI